MLRDELVDVAQSMRALLEWQESTGATGLPTGEGHALAAPHIQPVAPRVERQDFVHRVSTHDLASGAPVATTNTPSLSEDERRTHLALLAEEVRTCSKCELSKARTQTVFARGNPLAELCFVGEGPGADEDAQGEPFVGKAGQLLDKMIAAMGYQRDDVYICNIVKCRPPNNRKPEPIEMKTCGAYLQKQLEHVAPKVIVALGATAVQGLIGTSEGIMRLRGTWKLYRGTIPVMPTFHPAYLLRQPEAKRDVWADLQKVMKHLTSPQTPLPEGRGTTPSFKT